MVKTAAEYKREQRHRDAVRAQEEEASVYKLFERPFTVFWSQSEDSNLYSEMDLALGIAGFETPDFSVDEDTELEQGIALGEENRGAFGRAERAADCLIEAGEKLSRMIRDYKLAEIEKAMARITAAEFDTPEAKSQAFRDFATLQRVKLKLAKQKR